MPVIALALASSVGLAPCANAAVVRCTGADGRVTYQDSSCPGHARSEPVDSTANQSPTPFNYNYASHKFADPGSKQGIAPGSQPANPAQWCKH